MEPAEALVVVHRATAAATAVATAAATGEEATAAADTAMAAVVAMVTRDIADHTTRQALTLRCECVWA